MLTPCQQPNTHRAKPKSTGMSLHASPLLLLLLCHRPQLHGYCDALCRRIPRSETKQDAIEVSQLCGLRDGNVFDSGMRLERIDLLQHLHDGQ